jgi:hypothetical protein
MEGYTQFVPFVVLGAVSGLFLVPSKTRNLMTALLFIVVPVISTASIIVVQQALSLETYEADSFDIFVASIMLLVTYFSQVCAYFFKVELVQRKAKQK